MTIKRLPLSTPLGNRSSSTNTDGRLVNCIVEQFGGEKGVRTRPGTTALYNPPSGYTLGLGAYNWNGDTYSIVMASGGSGSTATGQLYKNGVALGSVSTFGDQVYSFVQIRGATPRLVFQNGQHGYYTDGTTLSQMDGVIANYPTNLVPGIAYVDGYICVMDTSAKVWNSNIDDPTTWNSSDYIEAEVAPGDGVYILQLINFVVAVKQWSIEFLYDADNTSGSPFSPYSGAKVSIGAAFPMSVAQVDGVLFCVAQSLSGGYFVAMMEGMKPTTVSTPDVDRLIEAYNYGDEDVYGITFRDSGHVYYVLTLGASTAGAPQVTLVFDATEKTWYEWSLLSESYWPMTSSTYDGNKVLIQNRETGVVGECSLLQQSDAGTAINSDIYTPIFDGGTTAYKFLTRLELIGDKITGTAELYFSDDDYATWTDAGSIDLSALPRSDITQLGAFRRRAFHLSLSNTAAFRFQAVQLSLEVGDE